MSLHSHVLRTTTRELPDLLNEWATRELQPGVPAEEICPVYCGGRDWVVVIRHRDHGPGAVTGRDHEHGNEPEDPRADPRYLDSIGCDDRIEQDYVRVEVYGKDHRYFEREGGPAMPTEVAGLVEDTRRTWILYFGHDGRPTHLWMHRDEGGAVLGQSIIPVEQAGIVEVAPEDVTPGGVTTRGLLRVAGSEHVEAHHQVYVRIGDRSYPATSVETCNDGHGVLLSLASHADLNPWRDRLIEWMLSHPDLTGEGSAVDNALRLLDHAYGELAPAEARFLSAKTPSITRTPAGQRVTYSWEKHARAGDYDDLQLVRHTSWGETGNTEVVYSTPIYRHDYSPEDVQRLVQDLGLVLTR